MVIEAPKWNYGRHLIDGKSVFEVGRGRKKSRLHLVSFPADVEEDQIRELVEQRQLRGVSQAEWRAFVQTTPLRGIDFNIALMFTGQLDDSEARFPATMVYSPSLGEMRVVSNWTQPLWNKDHAFLFAEKPVKSSRN